MAERTSSSHGRHGVINPCSDDLVETRYSSSILSLGIVHVGSAHVLGGLLSYLKKLVSRVAT